MKLKCLSYRTTKAKGRTKTMTPVIVPVTKDLHSVAGQRHTFSVIGQVVFDSENCITVPDNKVEEFLKKDSGFTFEKVKGTEQKGSDKKIAVVTQEAIDEAIDAIDEAFGKGDLTQKQVERYGALAQTDPASVLALLAPEEEEEEASSDDNKEKAEEGTDDKKDAYKKEISTLSDKEINSLLSAHPGKETKTLKKKAEKIDYLVSKFEPEAAEAE